MYECASVNLTLDHVLPIAILNVVPNYGVNFFSDVFRNIENYEL